MSVGPKQYSRLNKAGGDALTAADLKRAFGSNAVLQSMAMDLAKQEKPDVRAAGRCGGEGFELTGTPVNSYH